MVEEEGIELISEKERVVYGKGRRLGEGKGEEGSCGGYEGWEWSVWVVQRERVDVEIGLWRRRMWRLKD